MNEWIERVADEVMGGLLSKQVNRHELVEALLRVQNETPVNATMRLSAAQNGAVVDSEK